MDAQAYLIRHGWSGPGNPLNPHKRPGLHGGLGLTRPILVARKQNNHGVGKKTTKDPTNQWWLRGFEDALKGVGDDSAPAASRSNNDHALASELYRFFVRGESLVGTIENDHESMKSKLISKRKRVEDDVVECPEAKKVAKSVRKEEKRKRRKLDGTEEFAAESVTVSSSEISDALKRKESGEERRLRRKEKEKQNQKSDGSKESTEADEITSKKKKKAKRLAAEEDYPTPLSMHQERIDSDEELKRPKRKKEKKESKSKKSKTKESGTTDKVDGKKKSKKGKKDKASVGVKGV